MTLHDEAGYILTTQSVLRKESFSLIKMLEFTLGCDV